MFSTRSGRSREPNRIARALELLAPLGGPRFDLTLSNPTRAGLPYPDELLRRALASAAALEYRPEPFGALAAREAIVAHVRAARGLSAADVLLTSSTSEAYSYLFKLLCDPGDAVLVPAPSYPLFEQLAELEGVRAVPYRLAYDGAWYVDMDSLRGAISPAVRAVIAVSPNNPTGSYLKPDELSALAELGLPLISDEVFAEYALDAAHALSCSALAAEGALVFALGGLSKLAGLPQLKLAWTLLGGPAHLRAEARERLELIADTFLSASAPAEAALPVLLEGGGVTTAAILSRCRDNLAFLEQSASGTPLSALRPEAGWSAVLRLPRVLSEEQLVLGLLEQESVLVQPGWFYDFEQEGFAVVSLLCEPRLFREGIARLVRHVTRVAL